MDEKKYLRALRRKLRCSSSRKREIIRQIRSDFAIAAENGQDFAQTIREMGTPEEVAAEFRENRSDADVKKARARKRALIAGGVVSAVLLAVLFACWLAPKLGKADGNGRPSEETLTEEAKRVIRCVDAGDYEALNRMMPEQVRQILTEDVIEEAKRQMAGDFGAFSSWEDTYVTEVSQQGQYTAVVELMAMYEKVSVIYTVLFDEELRLIGLYMR